MTTGRKTDYKKEYDRIAQRACKLGATDKDLADMFGVSERTINTWKKKQPSFLQSLKAKAEADDLVEQALFKRATGAIVKDDSVFNHQGVPLIVEGYKEYPPDTAACVVWLANRRPDKWKKDPGGEQGNENLVGVLLSIIDKLPN